MFAQAGNTDLGRLLLDVGADLIKPGAGGNQAVHMAAAHGHMGFLQMCVARGANLDVVNHGTADVDIACLFLHAVHGNEHTANMRMNVYVNSLSARSIATF